MPDAVRIVIAEDHPLMRDGLRSAFDKTPSLQVVAEASNGQTALDLITALVPDVAVLDIGLPDLDGVAIVRRIREQRLPVEVIFLTVHDDEEMFEEALDLGVKGYLLKDCTAAEIRRCVEAVASGQHFTSPSLTTYLVSKTRRIERFAAKVPALDRLTPQERAVLRRIAQGKTSKEIAQEMGIAPKTVDAHRSSICHKLELHGTHVLSRFAIHHEREI